MKKYSKRPFDCSKIEIKMFMDLVIKAGEVEPEGLEDRVKRAEKLIFMWEDNGELIGVAAVKRPNEKYKKRVFSKAQSKEDPQSFSFEIGWIVIDERFRGQHLSRDLLDIALQITEGHKVFATTRTNNLAMQKTNKRYGLNPNGKPYPTSRKDRNYDLTLFLK